MKNPLSDNAGLLPYQRFSARTMQQEPKNCPFCGTKPTIIQNGSSFFISCKRRRCGILIGFTRSSKRRVIEAWNRRSRPTEVKQTGGDVVERFADLVSEIPLGEESVSLGCSAYNWGQHYLKWLRKIAVLTHAEEKSEGVK